MNDRIKTPREHESWERLRAFKVVEGVEMTYEEIAEIAGCSRQAVEQLENRALRKLKREAFKLRITRELLR